jgi:DNA recombination protein RmuC
MSIALNLVWLIAGVLLGGAFAAVWWRGQLATVRARAERVSELENVVRERDVKITELARDLSDERVAGAALRERLDRERESAAEKLALLDVAERRLADTFKALSAAALKTSTESFLEVARSTLGHQQQIASSDIDAKAREIDSLVKPLRESLDKVDARIHELETARAGAYGELSQQVKQLFESQSQLQLETANLVKALRTPQVRGRWGEIQLQRVVEIAGMLEYCDFYQQETVATEDCRLRPDHLVRLPKCRTIVVD